MTDSTPTDEFPTFYETLKDAVIHTWVHGGHLGKILIVLLSLSLGNAIAQGIEVVL